jgi:hypothetical protein
MSNSKKIEKNIYEENEQEFYASDDKGWFRMFRRSGSRPRTGKLHDSGVGKGANQKEANSSVILDFYTKSIEAAFPGFEKFDPTFSHKVDQLARLLTIHEKNLKGIVSRVAVSKYKQQLCGGGNSPQRVMEMYYDSSYC